MMVERIDGFACPVGDWGTPLFTGDREHFAQSSFLRGSSFYLDFAHRGTISDCARVYWVKVERYSKQTNRALIRTLTEEELPKARLVDPVKGAWVEADLLHPLMRGRDLGRFCHDTEGWYQFVPNCHYEDVEPEDDFADKYPLAYSYFNNYRDLLSCRSTYRRYQKHLPFYVIYCIGEYSFSKFKVAWMEQQEPSTFRASVISKDGASVLPNRLLIPDHKLYFASLDNVQEAHYVCGFLNAPCVRTWLGGFLQGKQIGKTIFEHMHVPRWDSGDHDARRIAEMSIAEHRRRRGAKDTTGLGDDDATKLDNAVKVVSARKG